MGVAYYISCEPCPADTGDIDIELNGKTLAHLSNAAIKRVCREAGVRPLSEFCSQNPDEVLAFLEDEGIDPPAGGIPPEEWFDAGEGVQTFRALLARADVLANRHATVDRVVEELNDFLAVLTALHERGIRWHLGIDF